MPSVNMSMSTLFLPDVLKRTIVRAGCEERLCVGLDECLEHLNSCDPYKILACVFTTDDTDAVADRFSQTLLETYCYEQSIPFMKTDLRMMKRILKCILPHDLDRHDSPSCMIIMKSQNGLINADESELVKAINMSEMMNEETLVLAVNSTPSPTSPSRKIT